MWRCLQIHIQRPQQLSTCVSHTLNVSLYQGQLKEAEWRIMQVSKAAQDYRRKVFIGQSESSAFLRSERDIAHAKGIDPQDRLAKYFVPSTKFHLRVTLIEYRKLYIPERHS